MKHNILKLSFAAIALTMALIFTTCKALVKKNEMKRSTLDELALEAPFLNLQVGHIDIEMVRIPSGEFIMGSPENESGHGLNEEPIRMIHISKPYYIGRYEITESQYWRVMGELQESMIGNKLPITQIKFIDAVEYCRRLSDTLKLKIRLPKEAEWEYACRAGTQTPYCSGSSEEHLNQVGWYSGNSEGKLHAVGQKMPNNWGLYDVHGNVWEYCIDFIADYEHMDGTDPIGIINHWQGALRGGGFMHKSNYCRSASRLISDDMFGGGGIRIVLETD